MTAIDSRSRELTLSANAIKRLAVITAQDKPDDRMLRVTVAGGGCSGFQYSFDLDRARGDDDLVFETDGMRVVTDSMSFEFIGSAEIDYVEELIGSYFTITNPNATASCSCGASFAVG